MPAHSCLLLPSRDAAERFPRGTIRLALCEQCGCIWNTDFDPSLISYTDAYEDTQACSARFAEFAHALVNELVQGYGVRGKHILEIGCGQGDFLLLLCAAGGNSGVGIDPAVDPARTGKAGPDDVTFVVDEYSERYTDVRADLVVCRHTLEHLANAGDFLRLIRESAGKGHDAIVYLEVPDVERVLREGAFWDVYYEHCCYFTAASFARLVGGAGFDVVDARYGFDGQYILLWARPSRGSADGVTDDRDVEALRQTTKRFRALHAEQIAGWNARLARLRTDGRRVVLWGSGSKAVAFLTAVDAGDAVECVVDINPRKHGMYMAGVRQQIVPPSFLAEHHPDVVIIMNEIYRDEIRADLESLGIAAALLSL